MIAYLGREDGYYSFRVSEQVEGWATGLVKGGRGDAMWTG